MEGGGGQLCRTGQEQERNHVGCGMERGGRTVYNKVGLSNLTIAFLRGSLSTSLHCSCLLLLVIQERFSYSGTTAVRERSGCCLIWNYTWIMITDDSKQRLK